MNAGKVSREIREFLGFHIPDVSTSYTTLEKIKEDGYLRLRISYTGDEGDDILAYLLEPEGDGPFGAVLVHHQHAGQRHLGKSEVVGLAGDPLQAFGPALARAGLAVLAPDSICFEDRRRNRSGTEADEEADIAQHYNEMCYRLLRGDTLMRKVLSDSALGISFYGPTRKLTGVASACWDIPTAATLCCSMAHWMNGSGSLVRAGQHVPIGTRWKVKSASKWRKQFQAL